MALGSFSNGGLGMGVAFTLEDNFSRTAAEIQRQMTNLDGATSAMARGIETSMNRMKMGAIALGLGIAMLAPLKKAADVRAEYQAYEVQFETLFKSAEKAQNFMNKIKADASDSPIFGTSALVGANAALVSNGIEADRARGIVNNLGNALAGVGRGNAELSAMSVNLQQIATNGKASSMDIKQFAMAGLPIYKLLSDATGKTTEELRDMDVTLEQLEKAFAFATTEQGMFYKATDRAAQSTKGLKAAMEDNIELTFERIGAALEPITRKMYKAINGLLTSFKAFASSPMGAAVVRITAAVAAFLVVGGLALILIGATRFAVYKMAGAFAASTKAKIIEIIATKGLSAGLREMGVAAWASIGPFALIAAAIAAFVFIAKQAWEMMTEGDEKMTRFGAAIFWLLGPIGWIIGLIAGVNRGFKELNEGNVNQGGLIGFFTEVAGVISAALEIWESFNGETFTLSDELAAKLESMGILEFVINLGTWISRIKMFFMGFIESLQAGWESISNRLGGIWDRLTGGVSKIFDKLGGIWEKLKSIFAPITQMVNWLLEKLGFGKGALSDWGTAGEMAGNIIMGILEATIAVVGFLIDAILWIIDAILSVVDAFLAAVDWIISGIGWIIDGIVGWVSWLFGLAETAYNFGVTFMTSLWEGLKSIWESVKTWLSDAISSAIDFFMGPINAIQGALGFGAGEDGTDGTNGTPAPAGIAPVAGRNTHSTVTSKTTMYGGWGGGNTSPAPSNERPADVHVSLIMDGDKVGTAVARQQELKGDRA